jgi:hypothetical protein
MRNSDSRLRVLGDREGGNTVRQRRKGRDLEGCMMGMGTSVVGVQSYTYKLDIFPGNIWRTLVGGRGMEDRRALGIWAGCVALFMPNYTGTGTQRGERRVRGEW